MIQDDVIGVRKERLQNNFDERLFAEYSPDVALLNVQAPARTPQKCERYTLPELTLVHMEDANPRQVIISETSPINDVTKQISAQRSEIRRLREEYSSDLQRKWKSLLASNPKTVVRYVKTSTVAFRKAKWKKIPTGKSRVIHQRVHLKARPVWKRITVPVDSSNPFRGSIRKLVLIPDYRPYVLRELIVPIYQKIVLRPAGLRRVTVRTKQTIETYDWPVIRSAYVVYKIERRASLDAALEQVQGKLKTLYSRLRKLIQQPHRLIAHSDHGWIPPSWKEYYYLAHRGVGAYESVYAEAFKPSLALYAECVASNFEAIRGGTYVSAIVGALGIDEQFAADSWHAQPLIDRMRQFERGDHEWPLRRRLTFEAKSMLCPKTVVGRMKLLDGSTDQVDDQREALAASTVRSLRNKSDYVFNLPRSIGELKDSKETFKQGYDFLRWIARGTRTRNALPEAAKIAGAEVLKRSGSASLAIVAAFLAWKFAIQPTIQDCLTFRTHTAEWLLASRRHLMETIKTLKNLSSNILHIRAKFRGDDAVRQKSLVNIAAEVGMSDDVIVEMTQSTELSSPMLVGKTFQHERNPGDLHTKYHYQVSPTAWVPYEGCESMHYSSGYVDDVGIPEDDPWQGPLFRIRFPANAVTASCQFFNELWQRGNSGVSTEPGSRVNQDLAIDDIDSLKACYEKQVWPKAEVTGYLKNHVEGVAFARYVFSDVLEFLEMDRQNGGLESLLKLVIQLNDWDKVFDAAYKVASKDKSFVEGQIDRLAAIEASWDMIYVAWQLTPLSFVYDWLTTSDSVATVLNNFQTEYSVPAPPAMEGIWVTKRCELLAGRPGLTIDSSKVQSYVSEWWTGAVRHLVYKPASQGGALELDRMHYFASPRKVITSSQLIYKTDREVSLARSGLYVAKRGEFIDGGWETFLPRVQVKLSTGKVGTLLGILAGFIHPK